MRRAWCKRADPLVSERRAFRVFLSSPSDVRPERLTAERVVERMAREFAYHFDISAVMWEREPLVATAHFQDNIVPPHETDITVVILWSRLGVELPEEKYRGPISQKGVTGTEWEFEDALASFYEKRLPDLLLYRKKVAITGNLENEAELQEQLRQKRLVEEFMARWTRSADGKSFTAASWPFEGAADFEEMLEQHLRELIRRRLTNADEEANSVRWHEGSPFRGLQSFEVEHAPVFFGRTRARNELRELLARQQARGSSFVLVMGASGSGKSSLVKAGLLPDVTMPGMVGNVALCRYAMLRPGGGADVVTALAAALLQPTALPELAELQYDTAQVVSMLCAGSGQLRLPIRQGLAAASRKSGLEPHAEARLLLVVDQLEELFTHDSVSAADREAFVTALAELAKSGLVWVVATLRSDFFDRLETVPALLTLSEGEARYLLAPPESAEIAQMIRQPAREAGLRFEVDAKRGVGLDEVVLEAAARDPGALPLLSFLLDQLWQGRDAHGVLTFDEYERLGGLEGSLGRRAQSVFAVLPDDVQKSLPEVLRQLVSVGAVTSGGSFVSTARSAPIAAFPEGTPRRVLVDALLKPEARLLVASAGDNGGGAQVRVAHEALLTYWDAARQQVAADARDLALRARLEEQAARWHGATAKGRDSLVLQPGLALDEARDLQKRWGDGLSVEIAAYIVGSRRAAQHRKLKIIGVGVAAMLLLPVLYGVGYVLMVWYGVRHVEHELSMADVPGGCYLMGSPPGEPISFDNEHPAHQVCVKPFQLSKYELTQEQWKAVMLNDPAQYVGQKLPVENVSWDDAQRFIQRMNFFGSHKWRLPTEAEWEHADRGSSTTTYPWGNTGDPDACRYANINDKSFHDGAPLDPLSPQSAKCSDGYFHTAPVGSFLPNQNGLFDMHGNVWEWMEDEYHADYNGAPVDGSAWTAHKPRQQHTIRGGSWHSIPERARAAQRDRELSDYRIGYIGMRLALDKP